MNERPNKALKVFGWIIVVTVFLGNLFKIMHYPGGSVLVLSSAFIFLFFYLPFWLPIAWREKKERFFISIQFIFIFLYILWQTIKFQHWQGAMLLSDFLFYTSVLVLLPVSLFKLYRFGRSSFFKFNNLVFLFYLIVSMQTNLWRTSQYGTSVISHGSGQTEDAYAKIKLKSKYLYTAFEQIKNKEQNPFYQKSVQLKSYTDSTENYLHKFKINVIKNIDTRQNVNFDTLSISHIYGLSNVAGPTHLIVGSDPEKPIKGKNSGRELESVLIKYRDSVLKYVNDEDRVFVAAGIDINTDDIYDPETEEKENWVTYNFNGIAAISVLVTLTKLEYEIKNAEATVLTNLLTNASKDVKDNLALRVADLGFKLDKEKKDEEIKDLQQDKDLKQLKLDAKNQEIEDKDRAIIWFVFILIAFCVMIFYIIRSNVLRARTNKQLEAQKKMIEEQKVLVEEKNKEVLDSITYAKRLQDAILPPLSVIKNYLPESFVLYKPKDIVAGDFYWMERVGDIILISAADCTGHGVPGAMVSVVCSNALNRTVKEFKIIEPGKILDKVRELVLETFEKSESEVQDGMDISLCCLNIQTKEIQWSGANNPLWYIQNGEFKEATPDKQPIGKFDFAKPFNTISLKLQKGDTLYLFTDGYADQFGGPKGKKFKYKQLQEKLVEVSSLNMDKQKEALNETIESWKGKLEQVDDVLVIGIRV